MPFFILPEKIAWACLLGYKLFLFGSFLMNFKIIRI